MGNRYKKILDEKISDEKVEGAIALIFVLVVLSWISYYYYYDIPEIVPSSETTGIITKVGMDTSSKYDLPSTIVRVTINSGENVMATNPHNLPVKPRMEVMLDIYKTQYSNENHYKIRKILSEN